MQRVQPKINTAYPQKKISFNGELDQRIFRNSIDLAKSKDIFCINANPLSIREFFEETFFSMKRGFSEVMKGDMKVVRKNQDDILTYKNLENEEITVTKTPSGISYTESKPLDGLVAVIKKIEYLWNDTAEKLYKTTSVEAKPNIKIEGQTGVSHISGIKEEFDSENGVFINPKQSSRVGFDYSTKYSDNTKI